MKKSVKLMSVVALCAFLLTSTSFVMSADAKGGFRSTPRITTPRTTAPKTMILKRVTDDPNEFTDEEQEEIKRLLREIRERV